MATAQWVARMATSSLWLLVWQLFSAHTGSDRQHKTVFSKYVARMATALVHKSVRRALPYLAGRKESLKLTKVNRSENENSGKYRETDVVL